MANITTSGTLFKPELVKEMFNKVKGHSTLAKLCAAEPLPFAGIDNFVFSMDGEAAIVGEGAAKPAGAASLTSVTIKPIKFVYQHRVTDEFVRLSEEKQVPYLAAYADGFAKKIARGMDIAAFHGINPADKQVSATVGDNCFEKQITSAKVDYDDAAPDDGLDEASAFITESGIITGIAMTPAFGAALGKMKTLDSNLPIYPEFRFGGNPAAFGGIPSDVNSTLAFNSSKFMAIIGDFANAFRWGYADEIPLEIIPYGDPDGLGDLKKQNQIVLRSEAYIGWGILDKDAFAAVKQAED